MSRVIDTLDTHVDHVGSLTVPREQSGGFTLLPSDQSLRFSPALKEGFKFPDQTSTTPRVGVVGTQDLLSATASGICDEMSCFACFQWMSLTS